MDYNDYEKKLDAFDERIEKLKRQVRIVSLAEFIVFIIWLVMLTVSVNSKLGTIVERLPEKPAAGAR